jgi:hypothetical protein
MNRCPQCNAVISAWEIREAEWLGASPCWCRGIPDRVPRTLANLAYAELCDAKLSRPVRIHDVVRFVEDAYSGDTRHASMNVSLSQGKRFCWGGRALYGLARHGLIPGARTLAEAAYALLLAAPRALYLEEVDFVLEQLSYRYNVDSLMHHLRGYTNNRWALRFNLDHGGRVAVDSGRDARHDFNIFVGACPTHVGFDEWLDAQLRPRVIQALDDRAARLEAMGDDTVHVAGDRVEFR